jgi:hypothetical protein
MKKYAGLLLLFASLLLVLLDTGAKTSFAASNTVLSDDFSTSVGSKWSLLGNAAYSDGAIRLTSSGQSQVGTIWLDQSSQQILPPYTVTFRFKIDGVDSSNVGADGIVFMFNKLKNNSPVSGGGMGFETINSNGYGIEFDTYNNAYDPSYDHISLFKNNPDHSVAPFLAQVKDTTFENAQWHDVKINVATSNVKVYLDNNLKINWNGNLDSSYSGIGLTASTGYYYNTQTIDDVVITKPATVTGVSSSLTNAAYPVGTVVPIEVTFNDAVQVTGAPQLSLNTLRNAVYESGSGGNKLTFKYTVQASDKTSDLNYSSITALGLNSGTIIDSAGNNAELKLPDLSASGSLGTNKQIVIDTTAPTIGSLTASVGSSIGIPKLNFTNVSDGSGGGPLQMRFSNDNKTWTAWGAYSNFKDYTLPAGNTAKKVYAQIKDQAGNLSTSAQLTINPIVVGSITSAIILNEDDLTIPTRSLTLSNLDGRSLTKVLINMPIKGAVSFASSGTNTLNFTYTPTLNLNGADTFSYQVSDGISLSNVAVVNLNITPVNDAPVANNLTLNVIEDTAKSGTLTAFDVDGDSMTFEGLLPSNGEGAIGKLTLGANGVISYTPSPNKFGTDTFSYRVKDSKNAYSNYATITVIVAPVNDEPIANNQSFTGAIEDTAFQGTLIATDLADNDILTYHVSDGSKGTVTLTDVHSGQFTYTPSPDQNGTDTFTFYATDAASTSRTATVTITIAAVNDEPKFVIGANLTISSNSGPETITGWATAITPGVPINESSQKIDHFIVSNNRNDLFTVQPSITNNGTLSFTPDESASGGTVTVTATVYDDGGTANGGVNSYTKEFTVLVAPTNSANLTFSSISTSNDGQWTKEPVTITSIVYSNGALINPARWAVGTVGIDDFKNNAGTAFTIEYPNSFEISENGTYTIFATDANITPPQYTTTEVTISHIDHEAPTININGGTTPITVEVGSIFTDPGANVEDNSFPNATQHITATTSSVDTSTVSNLNLLEYTYKDAAGNGTTVTRSVYVEDNTAPIVTLLGANPLILEPSDTLLFTNLDPGIEYSDNSTDTVANGKLIVTINGDVNLNNPGLYEVIYTVEDSSHHQTELKRTVRVIDHLMPIINHIVLSPNTWTKQDVMITADFNGTGSNMYLKKWAFGEQTVDYFNSGGTGTVITSDSFTVSANGVYTMYAEDSDGNKTVLAVEVNNIDRIAPTGGLTINNGEAVTGSIGVNLHLYAEDIGSEVKLMQISNDANFANGSGWIPYAPFFNNWTLLDANEGLKTVYIEFIDNAGNQSDASETIYLDATGKANLSDLQLSDESLSLNPAFQSDIQDYKITVSNEVTSILFKPILVNNQSILTITEAVYDNGVYRSNPLIVGDNQITIRVTATTDGASFNRDYKLHVYRLSAENAIISFKVDGQATPTLINTTDQTVALEVYADTNRSGLIPQITLSKGATIELLSKTTNPDGSSDTFYYKVVAEDLTPALWDVIVSSQQTTSRNLNNLTLEGLQFLFDSDTLSYSVNVGPQVDSVKLTAVAADSNAHILINGTEYPLSTATHNFSLINGVNTIQVEVKNSNKVYNLNVFKKTSYLNSLSFGSGTLSSEFEPSQHYYVIHTSKNANTVELHLPADLPSNVKALVVASGKTYTVTGAVYSFPIDEYTDFILKITNLDETVVQEDYHFSINRWIGFAAANASGTEVTLVFKENVDRSTINPSSFAFTGSTITVASVRSDAADVYHTTVHLTLSRAITLQDLMLLNVTGVKSINDQTLNEAVFPIINLESVQQLQTLIDVSNDGVHIDDIIKFINSREDLTGDNVFDSYDIQFLLQQI